VSFVSKEEEEEDEKELLDLAFLSSFKIK